MTLDLGTEYRTPMTVYLYRQISRSISIALPSSICYDTPTDSSYARHCRHISYTFSISYFYRSCHADMFCTFFCPFGQYSNKQIPKTFAKSGILLSVEHFLCYDIYIWRQSCAAGNGGHIAGQKQKKRRTRTFRRPGAQISSSLLRR